MEEALKGRLRVHAAQHGRSMEVEARDILRTALAENKGTPANLFEAIRSRIAPLGVVNLEMPSVRPMKEPPCFEG